MRIPSGAIVEKSKWPTCALCECVRTVDEKEETNPLRTLGAEPDSEARVNGERCWSGKSVGAEPESKALVKGRGACCCFCCGDRVFVVAVKSGRKSGRRPGRAWSGRSRSPMHAEKDSIIDVRPRCLRKKNGYKYKI